MQSHSITPPPPDAIFREWLDRHLGLVLKVVRGCATSPQDQEDLFQEILLQLWSSIPAFRQEAKPSTWIYRVAFNTALTWQRGEKRRRLRHEQFLKLDDSPRLQPPTIDQNPESEMIEAVYRAIRQLPKVDASLALMHLDGVSYAEMAEILGISENYIGVKLTRIRRQLASQLKGVFDEL